MELALALMPGPLLWAALAHVVVALVCLGALGIPAGPLMGVHPALKPLKFATSIALFLATLGILLPSLSISPLARAGLSSLFAATMLAEMLVIVVQSARGTTSHFNGRGSLNALLWAVMVVAIVAATLGLIFVVVLASVRPLFAEPGRQMAPLLAFAWRSGLWLLLLVPVSGFSMGSRLRHSVGGNDGGAGLPFLNWSVRHGDLRVAHFFALHAVQLLPLLAWFLLHTIGTSWARWGVFIAAVLGVTALCVGTLVQALAGRPFIAARATPAHDRT